MRLRSATRIFPAVAAVKCLHRRIPLIVSVVLSTRCNFTCGYCGCWRAPGVDLHHDLLLNLFKEMAASGSHKVIFTGGEPFLRDDLTELIRAAKSYGLAVAINSNGSLLQRHYDILPKVDGISLSLDGPQAIHDAVRERGSYQELIKSAEVLQRLGVPIRFAVVVSRFNLDAMDELLRLCQRFEATLSIQPANAKLLFSELDNPLAPPVQAFRKFVSDLVTAKRNGKPISNSFQGLAYLQSWPDPTPIRCAGGRIFCRIEATGDITICGRSNGKATAANLRETGFLDGFKKILEPRCDSCWCGLLAELNLAFQLKPATLLNTLRYF